MEYTEDGGIYPIASQQHPAIWQEENDREKQVEPVDSEWIFAPDALFKISIAQLLVCLDASNHEAACF